MEVLVLGDEAHLLAQHLDILQDVHSVLPLSSSTVRLSLQHVITPPETVLVHYDGLCYSIATTPSLCPDLERIHSGAEDEEDGGGGPGLLEGLGEGDGLIVDVPGGRERNLPVENDGQEAETEVTEGGDETNRYTRLENLALSHSVFIQFSFGRKCRIMKPLLLSCLEIFQGSGKNHSVDIAI